jgi:hypothetical protein
MDSPMLNKVKTTFLFLSIVMILLFNGCATTEPMRLSENEQNRIITERYKFPDKNTVLHLDDKVWVLLKTGENYSGKVVKVDDYDKEEEYDFFLKTNIHRIALNFEQIEIIEITREVHHEESQYFLATVLCGLGTCGVVGVLGVFLMMTLVKGFIW